MFGFRCCTSAALNDVSNSMAPARKPPAAPMLRGNLVRSYFTDIETDYYIGRDQELGKGGCGVVVYGEHKETHAQYAIKIINKATAERGRLDRELKLLKDVDHANIVRLFSVYDTRNYMYFVMELCLGGHLGNLIARQPNKVLDEDWAKKLCRQILSAVAHIHSRGIAHRDIKLQNILIDSPNDRTAQVKLIDFGYGSRYVGALPMRTKCGTPYTTAPEVIRECYDERCDVWSVGVVLYIMLSGRRPFEALDIAGPLSDAGKAAMITNILAGRFHFNHKSWQSVSKQGIQFVKTLLHHDYRTRIRSAEALENSWLNDAKAIEGRRQSLVSAKSFTAVSKLIQAPSSSDMQRTGMVALVFGIQAYAAVDLRAVFQSFDADNSGALSKKEFQRALAKLAPELTAEDVLKLFDIIDIDKNQQISYTEFLVATLDPREVDMEELNKAFKLLDEDGNGQISRDELRKVIRTQIQQALDNASSAECKSIGNQSKESNALQIAEEVERKVNAIFDEVDINHDGVISHAEFLWAMTGLEFNDNAMPHAPCQSEKGKSGKRSKQMSRQYQSSPNLVNGVASGNSGQVFEKRPSRTMSQQIDITSGVNSIAQGNDRVVLDARALRNGIGFVDRPNGLPPLQAFISDNANESGRSSPHLLSKSPVDQKAMGTSSTSVVTLSAISTGSFQGINYNVNNNSPVSSKSSTGALTIVASSNMRASPSIVSPSRKFSMPDAVSAIEEGDEKHSSESESASNLTKNKERPTSASGVGPLNYTGILAQNQKLNLNDQFAGAETPIQGAVTSRSLAFYGFEDELRNVPLHVESEDIDHVSSSSSYDTDRVASLFGPPPGRKPPIAAIRVTPSEFSSSSSHGGSSSPTNNSVGTLSAAQMQLASSSTDNSQSEGAMRQRIAVFPQPSPNMAMTPTNAQLSSPSPRSTAPGVDFGLNSRTALEGSSAKSPPPPMLQKQGRMPSRGASFKRDISERFLDISKDCDESRGDVDVPVMLNAKPPSSRAFNVSTLLTKDADGIERPVTAEDKTKASMVPAFVNRMMSGRFN